MQNLIAVVCPNFDTKYLDWLYLREGGILAPTNDDVDEINLIMLSMILGEVKSYMSCDKLFNFIYCGAFSEMEPHKLLHSLKITGLPNHCLELKVGAPVILLRDLK